MKIDLRANEKRGKGKKKKGMNKREWMRYWIGMSLWRNGFIIIVIIVIVVVVIEGGGGGGIEGEERCVFEEMMLLLLLLLLLLNWIEVWCNCEEIIIGNL